MAAHQLQKQLIKYGAEKRLSAHVQMACTLVLWTTACATLLPRKRPG